MAKRAVFTENTTKYRSFMSCYRCPVPLSDFVAKVTNDIRHRIILLHGLIVLLLVIVG
ncbi:MAG: hypothetical protein HOC71_06810 [Candidatus Latescibacteria bacterium]|jgi:hypothetical protein|nr:hypothetical protein [Candidatus Latescibacterota bacterium]